MEAEMMGSFFSQLPVEITTDILSRLPVDSVIRCKLVCKPWRSLVQDPVFLDMHTSRLLLKQPDADALTTNTEFYLTVWPHEENRRKFYFGEYNNHEMSNSKGNSSCFKLSKPLNADDDPFSRQYRCYPISSSNGLICSYSRDTIYVYNPCTRESVRLPPPIFTPLLSGFGYNPLTNEYKVVQICSNHDEKGVSQPGVEVCVYTLGSGTWRTNKLLESWSLNGLFIKPGVFFNGALHWIVWHSISTHHYDIFSFDLATEEFRIIVPSPPLSPTRLDNGVCVVELGLWGGCCLCVKQVNIVTKTMDIWVLMNSKDIKSWTMKFKIPAATTDEENKFHFYYPISLLGREKILLYSYKRDGSFFVSYDSETGNFEDEVIDYSELQPSKSNWSYCSVIPYTKTFVSLKAYGEEDVG